MSVASVSLPPNTPITVQDVQHCASQLGITLTQAAESDLHILLAALHESAEALDKLEDYVPEVDFVRFPRVGGREPAEGENDNGAWAYKVTIQANPPISGPLSGRTICIKDNITVASVPCKLGTSVFSNWIPKTDATVVKRVLEAGGTVVGKAVCENFSMSGSSFTAASGPVQNPYARGWTAGGSSSGCGYLVGSGEVDLGIGGDQGGSIRLPAAFCGLVGMKPTFGLVPYTGIISLDASIDYTGPMSRGVLDNALMLRVMAGTDGLDDRQMGTPAPDGVPDYPGMVRDAQENGIKGLKIGVLKESFALPCMEQRMEAKVREAAARFTQLGAVVEEVSVPMHLLSPVLWSGMRHGMAEQSVLANQVGRRGVYLTDLPGLIRPLTQEKWDKFSPISQNLMLNNVYLQEHYPHLYGKAQNLYRRLRAEYDKVFDSYDVLITPTTPFVANTNPDPSDSILTKVGKSAGLTLNTCPFNGTGHPALNLPIGWMTEGGEGVKLPVGMQLVGPWWGEGMIYRAAAAWEKEYNWKEL
ncbi:amidase signature enzyme [Dacryopinax primogenitus]|uniref:Amidase signature enzyme n=1 Tax=Dacryopinax primogenitus (strain DJM 731) TaxID=1858805 RepID=M5GCR1_DACPD|nr:amidase signature enzyme [Dacryopinax primogenitus]EJU01923.1 amidase signature enzyme [Dacryopinax primogenitus]